MKEERDIAKIIESRIAQPKRLTLNLALPITDKEFHIGGTMLGIWDAPLAGDTILVRFNDQSADQIPMKLQQIIVAPFDKVFITVAAGLVGNMEILYGAGTVEFFRIYPAGPQPAGVLENILAELQGDLIDEDYGTPVIGMVAAVVYAANAGRKGFDLQAGLGNAGNVYIGFDNAVTAANAVAALVAGQSYSRSDYRGPLWAIASAAGQLLNRSEV